MVISFLVFFNKGGHVWTPYWNSQFALTFQFLRQISAHVFFVNVRIKCHLVELILYVPVNNFTVMLERVYLG